MFRGGIVPEYSAPPVLTLLCTEQMLSCDSVDVLVCEESVGVATRGKTQRCVPGLFVVALEIGPLGE
jgi:hypothetical protein